MVGLVSFIIVFSVMIFVHEFGHFITAKLSGVTVEEFGFGYPPRLVRLGNWKGTDITINMLPLGGFVRMSEDDPSKEGSLARKGRGTRALVYGAGAIMNLVLAVVLYSTTFLIGALTPVQEPGAGIYTISAASPAELAGLLPGDNIISIAGEAVDSPDEAATLIKAHLGEEIEMVVRRNGEELPPIQLTPRENAPANEGAVGVGLDLPLEYRSYPVWQAVPMGAEASYNTVRNMFLSIRAAIRGEIAFQVSGPIGIYKTTAQVAETGISPLLEFSAFLSLNLFLVNLLPLPALDGGRLIFILLEVLRGGRRIAPEKEGAVHAMGMLVLLALMAVVTFYDYLRYFG